MTPQEGVNGSKKSQPDEQSKIQDASRPGDSINEKLERMVLPSVYFDECPPEETLYWLRIRAYELDSEIDPPVRGVPIFISFTSPGGSLVTKRIQDLAPDERDFGQRRINMTERKDAAYLDVLTEICKQAELDAYSTTVGLCIVPLGEKPAVPSNIKDFKVLRKVTR